MVDFVDFVKANIGYFIILAGISHAFYYFFFYHFKMIKCQNWPSIQGEIVFSEISSHQSAASSPTSARMTMYKASIKYKYEVNGREYYNTILSYGGQVSSSGKTKAQETCNRYPVGSRPQVYYNPDNPKESCLEKSASDTMLIAYGADAGAIILGLLFISGIIQF